MTNEDLDPITLAVVGGALASTVKYMTEIVRNTARSATISIGHDFSTTLFGVFDGVPTMVCQGEDQPVHLGVLIHKLKLGAAYFGADDIAPGDVMFHNDPGTGGNHLPDFSMYRPLFFDGVLFAWAAITAHMPEIGGPVPGGSNPEAENLFSEGLRVPHIKLCDAGKMRHDIWDFVVCNMRTPDATRADMGAMFSALNTAEPRMTELCEKFGIETVRCCLRRIVERAENMARDEIRAMPDGTYVGSDTLEGDARGSGDITIRCTLRIDGDQMEVALAGPPQTRSFLNSYRSNSISAVYWAYLSSLGRGMPVNEGLYAPLHVDIGPPGTIVNPVAPAASYACTGVTFGVVFSAVCQALSYANPERACAAWLYQNTVQFGGTDPRDGEPYAYMSHLMSKGGGGAYYGRDGGHMWGIAAAGGANMTGEIELLELRLPIHVVRHELLPDSGCPGRWRGGCGADLEMEIRDPECVATRTGGGILHAPASRLEGGGALDTVERVNRVWIRRASGEREEFPLHSLRSLAAGDRVFGKVSGGGGVGPAWERDLRAVEADVTSGLVTVEKAREEYGVAFSGEGDELRIDEERTEHLRRARR